jgi:hypothetical protein
VAGWSDGSTCQRTRVSAGAHGQAFVVRRVLSFRPDDVDRLVVAAAAPPPPNADRRGRLETWPSSRRWRIAGSRQRADRLTVRSVDATTNRCCSRCAPAPRAASRATCRFPPHARRRRRLPRRASPAVRLSSVTEPIVEEVRSPSSSSIGRCDASRDCRGHASGEKRWPMRGDTPTGWIWRWGLYRSPSSNSSSSRRPANDVDLHGRSRRGPVRRPRRRRCALRH